MLNSLTFILRMVLREFSASRTPQKNGISKRINRPIVDYARILMIEKEVSQKF